MNYDLPNEPCHVPSGMAIEIEIKVDFKISFIEMT